MDLSQKYNKDEQVAFVHGFLFAKAQETSESKEIKDINRIMGEIIDGCLGQKERSCIDRNTMLTVNGKGFHCSCGCNVFGKFSDKTYECNSCGEAYIGE